MGDFNEVMWNTEKNLRSSFAMGLFRDAVNICRLEDDIMERLDRFLATEEWKDMFPIPNIYHLPRYKSDHALIVINYCKETDGNVENSR